ncbi:Uncharacterised protein [Mycoplasmopsis californica]|uniref:Leucine-rich repeat protein n=1 Tax=Mycoplasmopsis equigenitalium TaxID=114883 RepID=A0ABY5J4S2_9BACT|nr:leucine-rich repeat domain-containing protein [Mycoplasmopsis equigenitalium]UUD36698.1 leucine-rich repeat protein [Mycoplasmopsis equigenitalium]VEU69340.1 Uncharacterised protein [Mycoplasmopsis californica]
MKSKHLILLLGAPAMLAAAATVTISCGNNDNQTPQATPNLDALKTSLNTNTEVALLSGVQILHDTDAVETKVDNGKKFIAQSAVDKFKTAFATAQAVKDETKAAQAKTDLEAAVKELKNAIKTGTKAASQTPNLDALKAYIASHEVAELQKSGNVLENVTEEVSGPLDANKLSKGKKYILKADLDAYKTALTNAKNVADESKATQAKSDLEAAFNTMKGKIVTGAKVATPNLDALKEFIKDNSLPNLQTKHQFDVLRDEDAKPRYVMKNEKFVSDKDAKKYKGALVDAKAVTNEANAANALATITAARDDLLSKIEKGDGTLESSLAFLNKYFDVDNNGVLTRKAGKAISGETLSILVIPERINNKEVKILGEQAFCESQMSINELDIHAKITEIGKYAFFYGKVGGMGTWPNENIGKIIFPKTLKTIKPYAFVHIKLTTFGLPEGVTRIETGTFAGAEIARMTLPKNLTFIGDGAFRNFKTIGTLNIPSSVNDVRVNAFQNANINELQVDTVLWNKFTSEFTKGNYTKVTKRP